MKPISAAYRERILDMMRHTKQGAVVDESNIYQEANQLIRPYIDSILAEQLMAGSGIAGAEQLIDLYTKARAGAACLLLLEHYSNFDLPAFSYLIRRDLDDGKSLADDIVAIAGSKLNEDNPVVAAFTEAYSRIVIYPSRALKTLDPLRDRQEFSRSKTINRSAMRKLNEIKRQGKLILVFPSGTRFRPWDASSKKGVREIDSYIKTFDYLCLVAVNGSVLRIQKGDMAEDFITRDTVIYSIGQVQSCDSFRTTVKAEATCKADKKQAVVDAIMAQLEAMHEAVEKNRQF